MKRGYTQRPLKLQLSLLTSRQSKADSRLLRMDPCTMIAAGAGAVAAVVGAPAVLAAAGFTGAGIAAGSVASYLMSATAVANGGGIAAGSVVAALQAAGAAGIPVAAQAVIGAIGGTLGAAVGGPLVCSAGATGAVTSGGIMGAAVSSVARGTLLHPLLPYS
ncbi:interferon alpha-inducible protein 27-like protein 2A isoform X1 [Carassius auratus]|uniref:Interferon alpha-inducible protein 27-like protein 2A isoform X1 n=1 Tax=Carassius auratus TaxID=7957 RepID=A0A6P6MVR8_CARAU|nr:interferon alpha-inducible protein 27-like protein 2A isoform X1 [Carassius auratus]XP_026100677.1 interferon alpha-inducible protein 27-like protein 2A isoform X1 [Carassius auratus]